MKRILLPSLGALDWRRVLVDPETQWERKHWDRGLPLTLDKMISGITLQPKANKNGRGLT